MAASLSTSQMKEEFKDEFLTCSICAEPYDDSEHKAKCLPCLHTFCKSCLQKIAGKQSKIDCPKCRKLIIFSGGTVDSLPDNFIVENLKEYQDIFSLEVLCGNCDDDIQAVCFCHDCGLFLCQSCSDSHEKMRSMSNHQLVTVEELQARKCNPMKQQLSQCKKHPKQDMTMYCRNLLCKDPVCASCGLLYHQGHDLIELSVAIDNMMADLKQSSAKVNERKQEFAEQKLTIEERKQNLTASFKEKAQEVKDITQELHNEIDSNCTNALSSLKAMYDTEIAKLDTCNDSLDCLTTQVTSACDFVDQYCDISYPMQLLKSESQIMNRLKELEVAKLPDTASIVTEFDFTQKHLSALVTIHESFKDFGDIKGNTQIDPAQCTIQVALPSEKGHNGYLKKAIVQAVDRNGHKMSTGGATIAATQEERALNVEDNNDGTYTFHYLSNLNPRKLYVKVNETAIAGSPFTTGLDIQEVSRNISRNVRDTTEGLCTLL